MALSPKKFKEAFRAEVDEWEKIIDDKMGKESLDSESREIKIFLSKKESPSVDIVEALRERYLCAGWKNIKIEDLGLGCSYLTFEF